MDPRHLMTLNDDELYENEVRLKLIRQGRDPDELVDPSGRTVLEERLTDGS